ncbi:MAG: T9SS type A sorting domain-containing protein [Algoriphagus aquaeductus]|uniref:T9SS type A sorting domain-containing protein n=1 Tax=Algoriphagus aquaeductus TaxID=475299 RepID=UPI0039193F6F
MLKVILFIILSFIFVEQLVGQTAIISGPTTVCPNNVHPTGDPNLLGHNYSAQARIAGVNATCNSWEWFIYTLDGELEIAGGRGNTITGYNFTNTGGYIVRFFGNNCGFTGTSYVQGDLNVNSRVKMPNPIQHVTAPIMCNPGQAYTYATTPPLDLSDPSCYYHYLYEWSAPSGWSIDGGGNSKMAGDAVSIVAPANTPHGTYTISVKSTIPSGQPSPFKSAPVYYTIRVGSFNSSEIYATGSQAVCNGNTYQYTAEVPGGDKNGYTYIWYFPSGWSVQQQLTNTITLYVPVYNSSYGPVRFSVDTGCGSPTEYSGLTTYPCNYPEYGNFMIYPNPPEGELNVVYILSEDSKDDQNVDTSKKTTISSPKENDFKIELYDKDQKLVKAGNSKLGKVTLETHDLHSGTYFLHIYFGKEVITKQIMVK